VRRRRCLGHARKRLAAVLTIEGSWRHVLRLHASRDVAAKREAAVLCLQMAFRSVLAKRVVRNTFTGHAFCLSLCSFNLLLALDRSGSNSSPQAFRSGESKGCFTIAVEA